MLKDSFNESSSGMSFESCGIANFSIAFSRVIVDSSSASWNLCCIRSEVKEKHIHSTLLHRKEFFLYVLEDAASDLFRNYNSGEKPLMNISFSPVRLQQTVNFKATILSFAFKVLIVVKVTQFSENKAVEVFLFLVNDPLKTWIEKGSVTNPHSQNLDTINL